MTTMMMLLRPIVRRAPLLSPRSFAFSRAQSTDSPPPAATAAPGSVPITHVASRPRRERRRDGREGSGNTNKAYPDRPRLSMDSHCLNRPEVKTAYIDTHCHLATTLQMLSDKLGEKSIPQDRIDLFAKQFFPENVKAVVDIHCDIPVGNFHEEAVAFPEWPQGFKYYFAAGAHPCVASAYTDEVHSRLVEIMSHPQCVAWGECGLDFHKKNTASHSTQRAVFARQIAAAVAADKPLVVHTRDADAAMQEELETHMPRGHTFYIHCFTASADFGRWLLGAFPNVYIGINGGITSKILPHVQDMIRSGELPLERILLETDSPFMMPENANTWFKEARPELEGKKNLVISHSGMIPFIAEFVAELVNQGREARGEEGRTDVEEVLEITKKNAESVYCIQLE